MKTITLRVLDGTDRGRIFSSIALPVTIGREEGNSIQLNDERISRFHLRIQQDHDDLVLTDLESTNGSKVNNEDVQLKILRHGDLISLGRSTLLVGTQKEIHDAMDVTGGSGVAAAVNGSSESSQRFAVAESGDWQNDPRLILRDGPPRLPERLSPGQAAQLNEVLGFFHGLVREVVSNAKIARHGKRVILSNEQWQRLLDAQSHLADYSRGISDPEN